MSGGSSFFERKVKLADVANTPDRILEHNGGRPMTSGSQSVVSSVPRWQKNPKIYRIVSAYMSLPTGAREFSIAGPLGLIALVCAWYSHLIFPVELTETPEESNFKGYALEPIYGDRGQVTGYRRVNKKEN